MVIGRKPIRINVAMQSVELPDQAEILYIRISSGQAGWLYFVTIDDKPLKTTRWIEMVSEVGTMPAKSTREYIGSTVLTTLNGPDKVYHWFENLTKEIEQKSHS